MIDVRKTDYAIINAGLQMLGQIHQNRASLITLQALPTAEANSQAFDFVFTGIPPILKGAKIVFA